MIDALTTAAVLGDKITYAKCLASEYMRVRRPIGQAA
jgi:hypothetical protein